MKRFWHIAGFILLVFLLAALFAVSSNAATPAGKELDHKPLSSPYAFTGVGTTNIWIADSSNTAWFCTSAKWGAPIVQYVQWTADIATEGLRCYTSTNHLVCTNATTSGESTINVDNAGYAISTNDIVVVWNKANDLYQRTLVVEAETNFVTFANTTAFNVTTNDWIFEMIPLVHISGGIAVTNTINAPAAVTGLPGAPLLMDVFYGTNAAILHVSGEYKR